MDLKNYYGKKVNIITTNGKSFNGTVNDYFFPEDNESGLESIVVDTYDGDIVEFTAKDIETIITE